MKKKFVIIVLVISFFKVGAQTSAFKTIDSLVTFGRYQKALSLLKKMPSGVAANLKTATIYASVDNHKMASMYYRKALLLTDDYRTKIKLGKSYQKEKKLHKAIEVFEEIVSSDTDNSLINYQLGKLYLQTKQAKKAVVVFKSLIKNDTENANYNYQLGVAYALLKKRDLKINSFLTAYDKDAEHIKSIYQLALAFTKLRDKDSAAIFINRGVEVKPNHIELNKLKINNLYRNKDYLSAVFLLEKIDSLLPNEHYTKKMLGRSFLKLKDYENAKINFNSATRLDDEDFKSYKYLGDIELEQKNYSKARMYYRFATFIGRKKRDIEYYQLGIVFKKMNKPKEEMDAYKEAFKQNFKNYRALYQWATTTENFYKDKRIAYKQYKKYMDRFETKDSLLTVQVKSRLKEIKKYYFLKGEVLN